ncbi:OsmC family protein [Pseudonocardia endophytica]|uniref:Putative OsmC-like protein n=1 Tax=Pseudonocardia endophytica TaxID=401976 RepID=A0A4R1HP19_PSEEN|nr:OsmC family protein [Pseudonocardia endophytica]TCK22130.1 putative OsmC-like protein [Pseudonocardia endophytica]
MSHPSAMPADRFAGTASGTSAEVRATLTATPGRYVVATRGRHLVTDAIQGPGEAPSATELLLSSLAGCGIGNVERHGADLGADLTDASVAVTAERDPDDVTRFLDIAIVVALPHTAEATARAVTDRFTATCPLYNTVRRGGPVRVLVEHAPGH